MIARVRLDISVKKEFDYSVPEELKKNIEVGSRVKVPFGRREVLGMVVDMPAESPRKDLRPVSRVLGEGALMTPKVMRLARWMADYYCCPLEHALKSVLPVAVRREHADWKRVLYVRALSPPEDALNELGKRALEVWRLIEEWHEMPLQEFIKAAETSVGTVRKLEKLRLVTIGPQVSVRDPYANESILPTSALELNKEQSAALDKIYAAIDASASGAAGAACAAGAAGAACAKGGGTFLLHGVTGSGKTEVYLQAIEHSLKKGRGAVVLVPEISLTPQTVERFKARFCSGTVSTAVAVLHSHLSSGERHDQWHSILQGQAKIVIGARSSVFAPVEPLGLIIVDEEHEGSYKQGDSPRYNARDLAVMRGKMENAVVILGSATPSMESYRNAEKGKYRLLRLPGRADEKKMPIVRIVDLRHQSRKGKGPPIFSERLVEAMRQRLEAHEQTMLFLNRRGYATSLQCTMCGFVAQCPNCSISLTYHRKIQQLRCHICGHQETAPGVCPVDECRNPAIRYSGLGTEKVEEVLKKILPKAAITRMDSDTLKRKEDYRKILSQFRMGKIDILLGTQMIAKGLHFPNVTLVGIVYADLSLHMPDFRAGERTFQLLTQVSGRAGRGAIEGEVIVQTFTPFQPAIQYAKRHDFEGFYEHEIEFRKQLRYPPETRIALITLKDRNEDKVKYGADYLKQQLQAKKEAIADLIISGPAPAPIMRAETFYRYQIMLRTTNMSKLSGVLSDSLPKAPLPEGVSVFVDIDPVNMM